MTHRPILLVEDNPDDVELTRRAFAANGITDRIVVARDGVDALAFLLATGPRTGEPPLRPALVLLDLNLPRIDGLEFLRRLRSDERTALLRVVVLTTSREQQDIVRSYQLGAASYVCKPVSFDDFVAAAGRIADYWLRLNEAPRPPGEDD